MPKIIVYVREGHAKALEAEGEKVEEWVRGLVKAALERKFAKA